MNKPIQILLVEDSPSDAALLRHTFGPLAQEGWQLTHVERLSEAIALSRQQLPDVTLLDLSLPDSDGLDTVAEFHGAVPGLPIVVLTGVDDEDLALRAVAEGAQDYLVKGQITSLLLRRSVRYAIERGQVLKQLHQSEQRFRGIFEQTFQLMQLLTPQGIVLEVNQTALELCGLKQEEVVGLPLWDMHCWSGFQDTQTWFQQAVPQAATGQLIRCEVQIRCRSWGPIWIDFSLKPLMNEQGAVVLLIAEGRDLSDRKRAEVETLRALEQERELNLLKSKFVAMISHEFRNPLTLIRIAVEMLQSPTALLGEDLKNRCFRRIQNAVTQMTQLLDEVLLVGKAESGGFNCQPTAANLEAFCLELAETLKLTASSGHSIQFRCEGNAEQVEIDLVLTRHILTNLLSNAIKYSPDGGTIHFDLVCREGFAIFRIQDRGIGISSHDQQRLFETFHRGQNVRQIQGTGLGLAIVKKCVDLHNGTIRVESEIGAGTTFVVTLPLSQSVQPLQALAGSAL